MLLIIMIINVVFIAWDNNQRENEMLNKAKKIISNIKGMNLCSIFKEMLQTNESSRRHSMFS